MSGSSGTRARASSRWAQAARCWAAAQRSSFRATRPRPAAAKARASRSRSRTAAPSAARPTCSSRQAVQTSFNNGVPTRELDTGMSRRPPPVERRRGADRGNVFHQTGLGGGHGSSINASLVGPFGFGQPRDGYGRAEPEPARGHPRPRDLLDVRDAVRVQRVDRSAATTTRWSSWTGASRSAPTPPARSSSGSSRRARTRFASIPPRSRRASSATASTRRSRCWAGRPPRSSSTSATSRGSRARVIATDSNGVKHGLPDVGISVDGIQAVTTTADGHYQVGRLSPGAHTIQIVEATMPSTVEFTGDAQTHRHGDAGDDDAARLRRGPAGLDRRFGASAGGRRASAQLIGLKNVYVVARARRARGDHRRRRLVHPGQHARRRRTRSRSIRTRSPTACRCCRAGRPAVAGRRQHGLRDRLQARRRRERSRLHVQRRPAHAAAGHDRARRRSARRAAARHRANRGQGRQGARRRERRVRRLPAAPRSARDVGRRRRRAVARQGRLRAQRHGAPQGRHGRRRRSSPSIRASRCSRRC